MHSIRKAASRASGKSGFFSGKSKQTVERADLEEAPEPTATADISVRRHRGFPWATDMAAAAAAEAAWLAVGATIDALDEYEGVKSRALQRKWRVATVVHVGASDARAAKVAWEGFASPKWDAWLPRYKLAPPGTHTKFGKSVFVGEDLGLNGPKGAGGTRAAAPTLRPAAPSFEQRLRARGLRVRRVSGDGACLFRSVAFQLWGEEGRHAEVRRAGAHLEI